MEHEKKTNVKFQGDGRSFDRAATRFSSPKTSIQKVLNMKSMTEKVRVFGPGTSPDWSETQSRVFSSE